MSPKNPTVTSWSCSSLQLIQICDSESIETAFQIQFQVWVDRWFVFWVVKIGHLDKFSAVGFLILTYQFHIYQHKKSTAVCGDHLSRCWQSSLYCSLTLRSPPKSHVLHVLPCPASAMGAPRQSPWIPKRRPGSTPVGAFSMQQSLQESETRHLLGLFHQPGWLLGLIFVQKCYPKKFKLVGGIPTALKNMKASWDHDSQYMDYKKCSKPPTS